MGFCFEIAIGQYGKITNGGTSQFIQMGARLYIPTLGRFAQVDPVYGGNANNYTYPSDPVNSRDLSGRCPLCLWLGVLALRSVPFVIEGVNVVTEGPGIRATGAKAIIQSTRAERGDFIKTLTDGRIRKYGKFRPAKTEGEMAGSRKVKEISPNNGSRRSWYETIDQENNVRIVRPLNGEEKGPHYLFDRNGFYGGTR